MFGVDPNKSQKAHDLLSFCKKDKYQNTQNVNEHIKEYLLLASSDSGTGKSNSGTHTIKFVNKNT
ncbi:hypothetical protein MIDIC_240025 [Alphaproteobacteria bacterium]